jgi:hypothetical protein
MTMCPCSYGPHYPPAQRILQIGSPIGGSTHAGAHIAFHFGAMYVLQIALHILAERSGEEAALALGMLDAELDRFMKAHAVAVQ